MPFKSRGSTQLSEPLWHLESPRWGGVVALSVRKMSYRGALISLCFPPALWVLAITPETEISTKYRFEQLSIRKQESGLLKPVRFGSSQRNRSPWRTAGMWVNWGHQRKSSWPWENEKVEKRNMACLREGVGGRGTALGREAAPTQIPLACYMGFSFPFSPLLPATSLTRPGGNSEMAGISWTSTSWCHACGTLGRPLSPGNFTIDSPVESITSTAWNSAFEPGKRWIEVTLISKFPEKNAFGTGETWRKWK